MVKWLTDLWNVRWGEAALCLLIPTGAVGVCAYGADKLFVAITGHDFDRIATCVTLAGGPALLAMYFVVSWLDLGGWVAFNLRKQMRAANRFRPWRDLQPQLVAGTGTMIVELITYGPVYRVPWHVWWTPDDVLGSAPALPPERGPSCRPGEVPFVDWCTERYLNRHHGTAVLTQVDVEDDSGVMTYPEQLDEVARLFQRGFPGMAIVVLPCVERRVSGEGSISPGRVAA